MALATAWYVPPLALVTAWFGPDGALETLRQQAREPDAIPVVIGPRGANGAPGSAGPQGPAGAGADDPGDLILYFQNGLT